MILIVIGALGTIPLRLVKTLKIRRQLETIKTSALLKSARIMRKSRTLAVTRTPVRNYQRTPVRKNSQKSQIIIRMMIIIIATQIMSSVGWGCKIHRLHL